MLIVLPGGLPPPPYAAELARLLPEHAPNAVALLERSRVRLDAFDPGQALCTPYEAWQVRQAGYADEPVGAGLGPLLAARSGHASTPGDMHAPVWVADFVHLALGTDHASLVPADRLALDASESQALFDAVEPVLAEHGFASRQIDAHRLQLTLPAGLNPACASPQAVAGQALQAWWQTDSQSRPWRRVLNEVQMVWHTHPVNDSRVASGRLPINALWLYGGGAAAGLREDISRPANATIRTELLEPSRDGDWNAWLQAIAILDKTLFAPLLNRAGGSSGSELLLLGDTRSAHLNYTPPHAWLRWLPSTKSNWTDWWSLPA